MWAPVQYGALIRRGPEDTQRDSKGIRVCSGDHSAEAARRWLLASQGEMF